MYDARDFHSPRCHFERSEKSFSSPFSPPSLSFLGEHRLPPFLRSGVSHSSLSNTLHLAANEKDPSASLGMTIRKTCFLTHSLCDARDFHSPRCHFERSEKSFSSPFSPPSLSFLGEHRLPPFLRSGVSHSSLSNTLHLAANEKDPSASLGMTIRETCFPTHSLYDARDIHSPRCHFKRSEK